MLTEHFVDLLRELDRELHSYRVTNYYRRQDARTRERFVALRAYVAKALDDATRARLETLAEALEANEDELSRGFEELSRAMSGLNDAIRVLDVMGDVLEAMSRLVPGVLDAVLP
ncbi:MAG: hypothetical protein KDA24_10760 [Deltaproteobacteria bacterium]|nr:hypothetical protein [Deltaproteobacteria bacterium]